MTTSLTNVTLFSFIVGPRANDYVCDDAGDVYSLIYRGKRGTPVKMALRPSGRRMVYQIKGIGKQTTYTTQDIINMRHNHSMAIGSYVIHNGAKMSVPAYNKLYGPIDMVDDVIPSLAPLIEPTPTPPVSKFKELIDSHVAAATSSVERYMIVEVGKNLTHKCLDTQYTSEEEAYTKAERLCTLSDVDIEYVVLKMVGCVKPQRTAVRMKL